jgi:hypothetical protein
MINTEAVGAIPDDLPLSTTIVREIRGYTTSKSPSAAPVPLLVSEFAETHAPRDQRLVYAIQKMTAITVSPIQTPIKSPLSPVSSSKSRAFGISGHIT